MIQELRATETDLKKNKRRLMKRRDEYLSTIAPTTGRNATDYTTVYCSTATPSVYSRGSSDRPHPQKPSRPDPQIHTMQTSLSE